MQSLTGVIPPVVTPMKAPDQLDLEAIERIVDHLIDGGASGLFVLGTTGEGPSLTYQMRYEMVERVCDYSGGRVPVLAGVTDTCLAESVLLSEHAHSCGATAVVAAAPFYFDVSQDSLHHWFTILAEKSPIPLLLYNMPSCVGVNLELETVVRLSENPRIAGIKDSSGDLAFFGQLCRTFHGQKDFMIFMGPEERLAEAVALGANGGVCGGANLLPTVYTRLYRAAVRNEVAEIAHWNAVIEDVFSSVYRDEYGRMKLIPALKLAMQQCHLCQPVTAPPLPSVSDVHAERIVSAIPRLLAACEYSEAAEVPIV